MVNPDLLEASRVANVEGEQASNVWRGVKSNAVFSPSLTQRAKDYPEYLDEYTKATMKIPDIQEASRNPSLQKQVDADAWRGVRSTAVFSPK